MAKEISKDWLVGLDSEKLSLSDLRPDVSPALGQELTTEEKKCYLIIVAGGLSYVPIETIYQTLYQCPNKQSLMSSTIGVWVKRIRAKLGETAIINKFGYGYTARNAVRFSQESNSN